MNEAALWNTFKAAPAATGRRFHNQKQERKQEERKPDFNLSQTSSFLLDPPVELTKKPVQFQVQKHALSLYFSNGLQE